MLLFRTEIKKQISWAKLHFNYWARLNDSSFITPLNALVLWKRSASVHTYLAQRSAGCSMRTRTHRRRRPCMLMGRAGTATLPRPAWEAACTRWWASRADRALA
eukprot:2256369-Pleurochrysis_carterae.AAC.3